MNILICLIEWYGENAVSYHLRDALIDLGHRVETVSLDIDQEAANETKIFKQAAHFLPEAVIIFTGRYLNLTTIYQIPKKFKPEPVMVLWECDDPWRFEQLSLKLAPAFDLCVTNDPYSLKLYHLNKIPNVLHIPMGCNPKQHYRTHKNSKTTKTFDVSFIGSGYPNRVSMLSRLNKHNLKIWGDQSWAKTPLAGHYQNKPVFSAAELRNIYSSAKININIHFRAFKNPEVAGIFTNQRPYEILGCGGFCLTDWREHSNAEFVDGKHLVFFRNPQELPKLVAYYLKHDRKRELIASQGYALVHSNYTYHQRLLPLLEKVQQLIKLKKASLPC